MTWTISPLDMESEISKRTNRLSLIPLCVCSNYSFFFSVILSPSDCLSTRFYRFDLLSDDDRIILPSSKDARHAKHSIASSLYSLPSFRNYNETNQSIVNVILDSNNNYHYIIMKMNNSWSGFHFKDVCSYWIDATVWTREGRSMDWR